MRKQLEQSAKRFVLARFWESLSWLHLIAPGYAKPYPLQDTIPQRKIPDADAGRAGHRRLLSIFEKPPGFKNYPVL
jgi:hypothetical protein